MTSAYDRNPVEGALRQALVKFAAGVTAAVEGITSRVEFHRSQVYVIAGTLTFFETSHPEIELVIITIHLRVDDLPRWEVDAMSRDSVVFAELGDLPRGDAVRMTSDPVAAATSVDAFLARTHDEILERLRGHA